MKNKKRLNPDVWSHVYGIVSVVGLVLTITGGIFAIVKGDDKHIEIVISLTCIICVIMIVFIISWLYYANRLKHLDTLPLKYHQVEGYAVELFEEKKHMAECLHTIAHYNRNLLNTLQKVDVSAITEKEFEELVDRFNSFLINITSSLRHYYTMASGAVCSVSIKITNQDELLVKTYFRDPISLKKRRKSDNYYPTKSGAYNIFENTAFSIILDPSYSNVFFANDNLSELYHAHQYENSNPEWFNHYNATIVVPISIVTGSDERNIIGFITVDNNKGELNDTDKVEFLFAVGDLLYNVFEKYFEICYFVDVNKKKNGQFEHKEFEKISLN
jgi:hypothetical protein